MRTKQLFAPWALLLLLELARLGSIGVAEYDELSIRGHVHPSPAVEDDSFVVNEAIPRLSEEVGEESSGLNTNVSGLTITFPEETTAPDDSEWGTDPPTATTETPATTTAPIETPAATTATVETPAATTATTETPATTTPTMTDIPTTAAPTIAPTTVPNDITSDSATVNTKSTKPTAATEIPNQSTASNAPTITASGTSQSSSASTVAQTDPSTDSAEDDGELPIASAELDSSTFQSVESGVCSDAIVHSVYTLYSNCRSAFDLCVSASDYQIFPYMGKHPTQAQIQSMAESDACVAVFIIVIEAKLPACTIGGMPLVSAVETLLKISVDLEDGREDEAPSVDVFQKLLTWRYEVDLAKAAGVPHDSDSEIYAEFEANLNVALGETAIRVNKDLSVDVRLPNGSYEPFEDALDLVITDASTDATPGYTKTSNVEADAELSSSQSVKGVVSGTSNTLRGCTSSVWSIVVVVAVVVSAFV